MSVPRNDAGTTPTMSAGEPDADEMSRAQRRRHTKAAEVVVADRREPELRDAAIGREAAHANGKANHVAE